MHRLLRFTVDHAVGKAAVAFVGEHLAALTDLGCVSRYTLAYSLSPDARPPVRSSGSENATKSAAAKFNSAMADSLTPGISHGARRRFKVGAGRSGGAENSKTFSRRPARALARVRVQVFLFLACRQSQDPRRSFSKSGASRGQVRARKRTPAGRRCKVLFSPIPDVNLVPGELRLTNG
jgi:hypothetical protein